ncbi:CYTH-like domain-containing protein [Lipomyces oligophaga]|uniref:CYTH-like domain-containing protein n=1 Tax=Lipomyces oligophaga TaxID=45792 RepID=UPI0034CE4C37
MNAKLISSSAPNGRDGQSNYPEIISPAPPSRPLRRGSSISDIVDPIGTPSAVHAPSSFGADLAISSPSPTLINRPPLISTASASTSNIHSSTSSAASSPAITHSVIASPQNIKSSTANGLNTMSPSGGNSVAEISVSRPTNVGDRIAESAPSQRAYSTKSSESPVADNKPTRALKYGKPRKPKKYSTPPIFARQWRPDWKTVYGYQPNGDTVSETTQNDLGDGLNNNHNHKPSVAPLYSTITNVQPYQDITRRIALWLHTNIHRMKPEEQSMVEIEAKIGLILDRNTGTRLVLPIDSEALLNTEMLTGQYKFHSDVGPLQLEAYVRFLKEHMKKKKEGAAGPEITHHHILQLDSFYRMEPIRVSTDTTSGKEIAKITKIRVSDLMLACPGSTFDVRISLNLEQPETEELLEKYKQKRYRRKDRDSFLHGNTRIDITRVESAEANTFEIECELDTQTIIRQVELLSQGVRDNTLEENIQSFIDNVRILVRRGGADLAD